MIPKLNEKLMMRKTQALLLLWLSACVLSALLVGCATPMLQDVGAVVVAPKAQIPPVPAVVQQTLPKPEGYFQQELLNYSSGLPARLTTSTSLMPAAGPML